MTPAHLAALKAVATAAETLTDDCERGVDGPRLARSLHALCNATKALRALPESGEEALKPGDEVEARYVKATDGTMVASFGEFIVCNRSVRADELPAILVEVAAHIPAAELRAVLARVRVP